ncbi:hypothetical protein MKX01_031490 [Papaver californicum]|nr:hypothetical protein MKX01_031490 [Papaver californicum]
MGMFSTICQVLVAGIAARFLYNSWFNPKTKDSGSSTVSSDHNHGTTVSFLAADSVSTLAHDLLICELTSQVPEELSENVASSKQVQVNWYKKLLQAWREATPTPKTPEQVSKLVILTLHPHGVAEIQGLLRFYRLPLLLEPWVRIHAVDDSPPPRPEGVKFELNTFPVDAYSVADGDGLKVYLEYKDLISYDVYVLTDVQVAVLEQSKARASKDYLKADALHKTIVDAGYRFLLISKSLVITYRVLSGSTKKDILARKYRIRLRGIDAPENKQPFGKEAKKELTKLVKGNRVIVHVYEEDKYGRLVGDVYCRGKFAQEVMLKKGLAWHYAAHDKRPQLIKWEKEARAAKVGLWASANPEKPWEWRRNNPREGN